MVGPMLDIGGDAGGSNEEYLKLLRALGLLPPLQEQATVAPPQTSTLTPPPLNYNTPNLLAQTAPTPVSNNLVNSFAGLPFLNPGETVATTPKETTPAASLSDFYKNVESKPIPIPPPPINSVDNIRQSLDEIVRDNQQVLGGAVVGGPLGGATAGSAALRLGGEAARQAGTASGTLGALGAAATALTVGSRILPNLLNPTTPSSPQDFDEQWSPPVSAPSQKTFSPSDVESPINNTPAPQRQVKEDQSALPSLLSPLPTNSPPQDFDERLPADFAQMPGFINTSPAPATPARTPAPAPLPPPPVSTPAQPVSNTVAKDNPWYIAPEELARVMTATQTTTPTMTERPGERTTIDNNLSLLPSAPSEWTQPSLLPGEERAPVVAPAPTPTPSPAPATTTPAPTPSATPTTPTASEASVSTGTGTSPGTGTTPGAGTSIGTGTGTGTTTPPPLQPPSAPLPPPPPPPDTSTPTGNTPDPGIVTPPGNQGTSQTGIPTLPPPPPVPSVSSNQVSVTPFTPPTPNAIQDRRDPLPTPATAPTVNFDNLNAPTFLPTLPTQVNTDLSQTLGALPQTNLPTLPTREMGNFQDYLTQNATGQMSQEDIAARARRMAEMQVNPELAQAEQDRLAAQQRFQLALSQVGTGKEEAMADLQSGFDKRLREIQAMAIRNGLTSSNIPLEQDINPLMKDFTMRQRTMEQGLQNEISRLQMEASLGDQDAGRRIQTLLGQLGLIESNANFDLSRDERNFGEAARQNRFGEFVGNEGLQRQQAQDTFGNQADLANMTEALRGNRMNETLAQAGLDRQSRQDQFGNEVQYGEMARGLRQDQLNEMLSQAGFNRESGQQDFVNQLGLTNLTEGMRQSDIGNNRADRSQSFQEWAGTQGMGMDVARLQEQLLMGGLDRALAQDELNNRPMDNDARRRLIESQIAQNNAGGGMSVSDRAQGSRSAFEGIEVAREVLRTATTPEQRAAAQRAIDFHTGQWQLYNPGQQPPASANPAAGPQPGQNQVVYEQQKAQAQSEIARLQHNMAIYEQQLRDMNPLSRELLGSSLQNTIQARLDEINRLKAQFGIE
jgi:hypothetical protein